MSDTLKIFIFLSHIITIVFAVAVLILMLCALLISHSFGITIKNKDEMLRLFEKKGLTTPKFE